MTWQNDKIERHMQIQVWFVVHLLFVRARKKKYRKNDVETLPELAALVNGPSKTNPAVCYLECPRRRWKPFLERFFEPVVGIRYSIVIVINYKMSEAKTFKGV